MAGHAGTVELYAKISREGWVELGRSSERKTNTVPRYCWIYNVSGCVFWESV
jgi:hypothetical protein